MEPPQWRGMRISYARIREMRKAKIARVGRFAAIAMSVPHKKRISYGRDILTTGELHI